MRTLRCGAVLVFLLAACRPETPGRDCTSSADCFREEICASGTCITRANEAPVGGAGGAGGAGAPDVVAADALATDAGAPDAMAADAVVAAARSDAARDAGASDVGP